MASAWFATGTILAAVGVAAGAFGAHGLKARATPEMLVIWETGVKYHLFHALGLLAVAWAAERWPGPVVSLSGYAFLAGILLFSGSLYLMTFTGARWLGAITPVGGVAFIAGWIGLAVAAFRSPR